MENINKQAVIDFKDEVDDMITNISAIHGKKAGDFVRMQCNVFALMRLWVEGSSDHPQRDFLGEVFSRLMQRMAQDAAGLADLTEEATEAADVLLEVIANKYKEMERRVVK